MFCPKCARPVVDGAQFCQQCGLALEGVRRALEGGEVESEAVVVKGKAGALSPRQRGYRQGFKLAVPALLLLPFYPVVEGLLSSLIPNAENTLLDELPLWLFNAMLFVVFAGGLLRMLYARMFESVEATAETEGEEETGPRVLGASVRGGRRALPPTQSIPVEEFTARRVNTADLAKPRSVTEHTTRSLRID